MAVEKAELESAGEGERDENDQRGCSWKGHAHAGSVLLASERVKRAERDVLVTPDVGRSVHMENHVYDFSAGAELGRGLLGGKGAGLAEMTAIGIPVPAGFTVTTAACIEYVQNGRKLPPGLEEEIAAHLEGLEEATGKRFGDARDPLLVSVRSGAAVSMPGMMDTILNLGLNDESVEGLARATGNERFAWDAYRRLVQMYGNVVEGVDAHAFEQALAALKESRRVRDEGFPTISARR